MILPFYRRGKAAQVAAPSPDALPTHDETGRVVRLAQWFPTWVYGLLLAISLVSGAATLLFASTPEVGSLAATTSAVAAAGFVLHDRPRVLSKRWSDLYWEPDAETLRTMGIRYESTGSAVWVVLARDHRKGRFPTVRLIDRRDRDSSWSEFISDVEVSPNGDVTVVVGIRREDVNAGTEVAVLIS